MQEFIEFLKNNVLLLVIAGVVIALFILAILIVPKRFSKYWSALIEVLPNFIIDCENRGIVGSANKLNYVLDLAYAFLASKTGLSIDAIKKRYSALIVNQVENILSTPEKKEGV